MAVGNPAAEFRRVSQLVKSLMEKKESSAEEKIVPRWLSVRAAGTYMCKSPGAVRKMLSRAKLAYSQDGRRILVDRLDIDRLMESQKQKAG